MSGTKPDLVAILVIACAMVLFGFAAIDALLAAVAAWWRKYPLARVFVTNVGVRIADSARGEHDGDLVPRWRAIWRGEVSR